MTDFRSTGLILTRHDLDYSSEAFTLLAVLFVPYVAMAVSMYPVQPIITLKDGITFGSMEKFFPEKTFGAFSSVCCIAYTMLFCIPKYIVCDIMLMTYYSTVDLDCESTFVLLQHVFF